jgi:hypothetical protein
MLGPSTGVRLFLRRMAVLARPDVAGQVAEHGGEMMVTAATRGRRLAKLAAAHYATEPFTLVAPPEIRAAPKRGAILFGHRT